MIQANKRYVQSMITIKSAIIVIVIATIIIVFIDRQTWAQRGKAIGLGSHVDKGASIPL